MTDGNDPDLLATAGGEDFRLWSMPTLDLWKIGPCGGVVNCTCWNSNNSQLATAIQGGEIHIVGVGEETSGNVELSTGVDQLCVCFSSNPRYLLSGSKNGTVQIWDLKHRTTRKTFKDHKETVLAVTFNYNDTVIASGSANGDILLHSVISGQKSGPLQIPETQSIRSIQYSHFKKSLMASVSEDGGLNLWDSNKMQLLKAFKNEHKAPATGLSFSPVNDMLLNSVGLDKRIVFYDVNSKRAVKTITTESPLTGVDFHSDGATVAVGSTGGKLYLFDLRSGSTPIKVTMAHKTSIKSVAFQKMTSKMSKSTFKKSQESLTLPQRPKDVKAEPIKATPVVRNGPYNVNGETKPINITPSERISSASRKSDANDAIFSPLREAGDLEYGVDDGEIVPIDIMKEVGILGDKKRTPSTSSDERKRYTSDTKPSTDKPPKATVGSWVSAADNRKEQSSSAFSDDKKRRTSDDKKEMPASPLLDRKERTISALSDGKKSRSSSVSSEDMKSRTTSAVGSSLLIGSNIVISPNLTSEGIHDDKKDKYFGDKKGKKTEDKKDKYYDDRKDKYPESKKDKRSEDKKEKHSEDKKRSPFFSRIESSLSSLTKKQDNPGLSRSSSTLSEDSLGCLKDYDIPSDTLASVNQRSHQKLSRLLGQDIPPSDTIPNVSQGDPNKLSKILGHEFAAQFNELKDNIDRNVREDISISGTPELSTNVPSVKEDVSTLRTREQLPALGNPDQAMNIPSSFVSSSNFTTVGQTVSDATNTVASTASAASGHNGFHSFQVDFIRNMIEDAMEDNRMALHRDMVNLQVEMLRQLQIQQEEMKVLMQQYSVNEELVKENERLREEVKRLKTKY